jgi:hypothetical protein
MAPGLFGGGEWSCWYRQSGCSGPPVRVHCQEVLNGLIHWDESLNFSTIPWAFTRGPPETLGEVHLHHNIHAD